MVCMYSNVVLLPYGQEPVLINIYVTHSEYKTSSKKVKVSRNGPRWPKGFRVG